MKGKKVKWTKQASASFMENAWSWYPDANSFDFDKEYEGEVIGVTGLIVTYLIVACTDNKVRKVNINDVQLF